MNNDKVITSDMIKPFSLEDLDGKTLKISVHRDSGYAMVVGREERKDGDRFYVLDTYHEESREPFAWRTARQLPRPKLPVNMHKYVLPEPMVKQSLGLGKDLLEGED
jgi:hypothetical protein